MTEDRHIAAMLRGIAEVQDSHHQSRRPALTEAHGDWSENLRQVRADDELTIDLDHSMGADHRVSGVYSCLLEHSRALRIHLSAVEWPTRAGHGLLNQLADPKIIVAGGARMAMAGRAGPASQQFHKLMGPRIPRCWRFVWRGS